MKGRCLWMSLGLMIDVIFCAVIFLYGVSVFVDDKSTTMPDLLGRDVKPQYRTLYARGMGTCLMLAAVVLFLNQRFDSMLDTQPLFAGILLAVFVATLIAAVVLNKICKYR